MFIEPVKDGDPFEVSDADTMLKHLAPQVEVEKSVSIVTKPGCPYCAKAKDLLQKKGIQYEELVLGKDLTAVSLHALSGELTVPQVFIDGKLIGGSDKLQEHFS